MHCREDSGYRGEDDKSCHREEAAKPTWRSRGSPGLLRHSVPRNDNHGDHINRCVSQSDHWKFCGKLWIQFDG